MARKIILRGADLRGASLTRANLRGAFDDWLHALADDGSWWQKNAAGWSRCEDLPRDEPETDQEIFVDGMRQRTFWRAAGLHNPLWFFYSNSNEPHRVKSQQHLEMIGASLILVCAVTAANAEYIRKLYVPHSAASQIAQKTIRIGEREYIYLDDPVPF